MIRRLMKYNPAFLTKEDLVKSFVVRLTDLELILETIRHNTGETNQHILIIGPRGSGKTSLVLRTVAQVKQDSELAPKWYPIVFGEDSYEVCSPGEFWLEALFHLGENTKLNRWQQTHQELRAERDETRLRERALAQLMDFADEECRRILLVVENLNMILGQQMHDDDAWSLRHTLLNEPRLMLLGTATSRFEAIENAGKAMYDLFRLHELKPLNTDDCRTMWKAITESELPEARVRPIEILTGGNPRLLSIIANFAAKTSFRELMLDLTQLVDDNTEYFKSHLDGLPPLERKVFVALADLWDPLTAREVADASRVEVNKTSALLNRLVSRGAVVVFEEKGRKKWYQVAERMYNIYHLMRRRGAPSSRIWAVVNFMIHFYESDHLVDIAVSIAAKACKPECELREDHYLAYELLLQKIPSKDKEKILIEALIERGDNFRRNPDQIKEAEETYREAIKINPNSAKVWTHLAILLHKDTGRYDEAEAAYRKAIELKPDYSWAWANLGQLLHEELKRYKEAQNAYLIALEINDKNYYTWESLIKLQMQELGDPNAAQNTMHSYIQKTKHSPDSLKNLACTIIEQKWEYLYPQVAAWVQELIEKIPMDWPHGLILAELQGAIGKWQDALGTASWFLTNTEIRPEAIGQVTDLFINAAAAGYPEEALNVLRRTSWVSHLEPLITGIQILLGEEPTIAQEILEVGRDVAKRIEARRRQISQDQQE